MSAVLLREAAAKMRSRAESAATGYDWKAKPHNSRRDSVTVQDANGAFLAHYCATGFAEYAASWHPAVALAVASLLDLAAGHVEYTGDTTSEDILSALDVARAYLGADA